MRRIPSEIDLMRDVETWELDDGQRVVVPGQAIRLHGALKFMHMLGLIDDPANLPRRPVYQCGHKVGTVPGDFDPTRVVSDSPLYDARPGDFVEHADGWLADKMLGPGDLFAVVGFEPET